jgi:hypothetical protein
MKRPIDAVMDGKQTLAAAKYSLSIGDQMNIDVGWLIGQVERLQRQLSLCKKQRDEFITTSISYPSGALTTIENEMKKMNKQIGAVK